MKSFSNLGKKIDKIKEDIPNLEHLPDEEPNDCPYCDGYGNIIDEKGGRLCSCVRRELILSEFDEARIPFRFKEESLETFDPYKVALKTLLKQIHEYIDNYSEKNAKGLYIYGRTGSGKTHLAIGILKALIARGYSGVFYNVVDLLDAIRETYGQNAEYTKNHFAQQWKRQLFVLDDFGVQKTSSWVTDRLYALINRRYQDCKTLIVTSNIPMNDLMMRVDETLASRIIDMCNEIEIRADDYRQHSRNQVSYKPASKASRYSKQRKGKSE